VALSESDKSEIRRHLGYPDPGSPANIPGGPPYFTSFGQANGMLGERMSPAYYQMEYRMINVGATLEVALIGTESQYFSQFIAAASAQVTATAIGTPQPGDILTLQIDGEYVTYQLTSSDTPTTALTGLASMVLQSADLSAIVQPSLASGSVLTIEARELGARWNSLHIRAWGANSMTLAVLSPSTGMPTLTLTGGMSPPGPSYVDPDQTPSLPIYGALPLVRFWESSIAKAEQNFDMRKAGEYVVEPREFAKRRGAYIAACRDMAQQLGVVYFGGKDYRGNSRLKRRGA
jgi:hypothetical protein